jgi:hypothetical protein
MTTKIKDETAMVHIDRVDKTLRQLETDASTLNTKLCKEWQTIVQKREVIIKERGAFRATFDGRSATGASDVEESKRIKEEAVFHTRLMEVRTMRKTL